MYDCLLGINAGTIESCYRDYDYNDCQRAIYTAVDQSLLDVHPTQSYFDAVDNLPKEIKAKFILREFKKLIMLYIRPLMA